MKKYRLFDRRVGHCRVMVCNHLDSACHHGPAVWPWWKVVSFKLVSRFNCDNANKSAPKSRNMRRLWIYLRWPRGDRIELPLPHFKGEFGNRALYVDFCRYPWVSTAS